MDPRRIKEGIKKVTCLLDGGHLLGGGARLTDAHLVLSEHSEGVWVAHDEIWDGGS